MYGTCMVHDCVVERAAAAAGQPSHPAIQPSSCAGTGASSCNGTPRDHLQIHIGLDLSNSTHGSKHAAGGMYFHQIRRLSSKIEDFLPK